MRFANAVRVLAITAILFAGFALARPVSAQVAVEFSVGFAPPELPVYDQPICPGEGYLWTPGYWSWEDDDQDYYWVPGTWVEAPQPGYLWTPGYWGWGNDAYVFHVGYWGPVVGYYGGIDYGWGYTGRGYYGGRWDGDRFYYNREVNHIDEQRIRNVYVERVENRVDSPRVSYNGPNGVNARPTPQEEAAARERHIGPVATQNQHIQEARSNRELRASANHGKPPIAATARPAAFSGGAVAARAGGNYNPPANRGGNNPNRAGNTNRPANDSRAVNGNRAGAANNRPAENAAGNNPNRPPNATREPGNSNRAESNNRGTYSHSTEVPKHSAPQAAANSNQKYQQQQEKLAQRQNQEHAKLQQRQEQEHQRATQQQAPQRQQQMEQRHQQQTQQMEQKHQQQQQKVQQRAAPPPKQQAPPRQQEEKKPH